MTKLEGTKELIDEIEKMCKNQTEITSILQGSIIASTLSDIAVSLAILADGITEMRKNK